MLRTSLRSYALAAGISALLVLPACGGGGGGGDDDDGIASLSSTTAAADDGDDSGDGDEPTEAEIQQASLDFAQCMRDHGIDMPDPEFTDGGGVAQRVNAGAGGPADQEAMEAAQEACQPIMEDVTAGFEPDPEREAEMREQALAFAQCMRDNGIENYPDPVFEDGGMTQRLDESMNPESPEFQEATEICQEEVGGPMGDGEVIARSPAGASDSGEDSP